MLFKSVSPLPDNKRHLLQEQLVPDARAHLSILSLFYNVITAKTSQRIIDQFYARAELRYNLFLDNIDKFPNDGSFIPPADVLLFWHTHLLNPYDYFTDSMIRTGCHLPLDPHLIVTALNNKDVVESSKTVWQDFFPNEPFVIDETASLTFKHDGTVLHFANPLKYYEWRYGQDKSYEMTLQDGSAIHLNSWSSLGWKQLVSDVSNGNPIRGICVPMKGDSAFCKPDATIKLKAELTDDPNWEVVTPKTVREAYEFSGSFRWGLDMVEAVKRQFKFAEKMTTQRFPPDVMTNNEIWEKLELHFPKYEEFLFLVKHYGTYQVPTLEVDLFWHTHQLTASQYVSDCQVIVGSFVNHNDKGGEEGNIDFFHETALRYYQMFKKPYSEYNPVDIYIKKSQEEMKGGWNPLRHLCVKAVATKIHCDHVGWMNIGILGRISQRSRLKKETKKFMDSVNVLAKSKYLALGELDDGRLVLWVAGFPENIPTQIENDSQTAYMRYRIFDADNEDRKIFYGHVKQKTIIWAPADSSDAPCQILKQGGRFKVNLEINKYSGDGDDKRWEILHHLDVELPVEQGKN